MVSFDTTTTPNGNPCAPSVLQLRSSTKKLDPFGAILSLRSYGSPLFPLRSNSLAPVSDSLWSDVQLLTPCSENH